MYKRIVITIVILSSVSLFNLIFIPEAIVKLLGFAAPAFMLAIIIMHGIYDQSFRFKKRFTIEISLIFISLILSMFGAYYFHDQGFGITATTQRFMYFLLFYPFLHVLKPKPDELIEIILFVGISYAMIYIFQTLAYPTMLVDAKVMIDRSTLRIAIPGSGFLFITYLISVTYFIKTYNRKSLIITLFSLLVFVLLGTRQVLAPAAFLTLLSVLFSKKVKSRALAIFLIMLMAVPAYFLFVDTFSAMIDISSKQASNMTYDVRYKSAIFYLFEFFPNKLSYIIGNGVSSTLTPYGMKVKSFNELLGYYQSDIGIIGDYSKFGILFVIGQMSLYIRILFMRLPGNLDFVKLNIGASLLTILLGSAFSNEDFIVIVCIMLYLVDTSVYFNSTENDYMPAPVKSIS